MKCYYTDYAGTKRQKKKRGFRLQREAKQWEADFLAAYKYDGNTTFGTIAERFLDEIRPRRRVTSIRTYTSSLKHILPTFAEMPIGAIEEQQIIAWQNEQLSKNYSDSYLYKHDTVFRTIYHFGTKRCKLPFDAFDGVEKIGKATTRSLTFWTLEQYRAFYKTLEKPVHKMAFEVLFYCGLRIGELFALTAGDVDLDEKVIHITKSLQREKKHDVITPPKTEKGIRDITIPIFLARELEEYMNMIYDCTSETRLFEISKNSLYYPMKKYSAIAEVPKIRIHDLRHSHVAYLIEKGVSPLAIAERLGHENVNITLGIYGHLYPNKQREIADLLDGDKNDDE